VHTRTSLAFGLSYLLLIPFCTAATNTPHPLRGEVTINKEAGRGGPLIVNVRFDGEELPFVVDTCAPITTIDKSLEPMLGKRLGVTNVFSLSDKQACGIYAAPTLHLNDALLIVGDTIITRNASRPGLRVMGMLGMDCLKNYCIQLDFEAGKLRFLDPEPVDGSDLGQCFPITFKAGYPTIHSPGFIGARTNLMIDVGCSIDGLIPERDIKAFAVLASEREWSGHTYTNILVAAVDHVNVLGLRFLARHLVTLNFPKQSMYLKAIRSDPLPGDCSLNISRLGDLESPLQYLEDCEASGLLPEMWENNKPDLYWESRSPARGKVLKSVTVGVRKTGTSSTFHHKLQRHTATAPWTLKKSWQTIEREPPHPFAE